jgi:molybdopterin-guanine dinucleotide biosynthesis protein A
LLPLAGRPLLAHVIDRWGELDPLFNINRPENHAAADALLGVTATAPRQR